MSDFPEYYDAFIRRMDKAEAEEPGRFLSFDEMSEFIAELSPRPSVWPAMDETVEHLLKLDWIETNNNGFSRNEQAFRISAKGQNRASASVNYVDIYKKAVVSLPYPDPEETENLLTKADEAIEKLQSLDGSRVDSASHAVTSTEPTIEYHPPAIDSTRWTGLPKTGVLSEVAAKRLKTTLHLVDQAIEQSGASNTERAQARAYALALQALAEAPEPPADLIWAIFQRANSMAGIASFFVSLAALFQAVTH